MFSQGDTCKSSGTRDEIHVTGVTCSIYLLENMVNSWSFLFKMLAIPKKDVGNDFVHHPSKIA